MKSWPTMIPADLRAALTGTLDGQARPLATDVWTDLRDWLIAHGMELPSEPRRDGPPYG